MKLEAIWCISWSEMCHGMGVFHFFALYYILYLSLKAAVLGAQHPEIWHGNQLAETAESKTMKMPCNKCQHYTS